MPKRSFMTFPIPTSYDGFPDDLAIYFTTELRDQSRPLSA